MVTLTVTAISVLPVAWIDEIVSCVGELEFSGAIGNVPDAYHPRCRDLGGCHHQDNYYGDAFFGYIWYVITAIGICRLEECSHLSAQTIHSLVYVCSVKVFGCLSPLNLSSSFGKNHIVLQLTKVKPTEP